MKELLTKSLGLLFALEGENFKLIEYEPPFIHSNLGCFLVCYGHIDRDKRVEIVKMANESKRGIAVDYFVIVFVEKQKTGSDPANTVIVANDENFKLVWNDAHEFAKTIKKKFWVDVITTTETT